MERRSFLAITCDRCQRAGDGDERIGTTCGHRVPQTFKAKTEADIVMDIVRWRLGLPSNDIAGERCRGTLLPANG